MCRAIRRHISQKDIIKKIIIKNRRWHNHKFVNKAFLAKNNMGQVYDEKCLGDAEKVTCKEGINFFKTYIL